MQSEPNAEDSLQSAANDQADPQSSDSTMRESYFTEYAQELCEDIGDVPKNLHSYIAIDWEQTAENIKVDYTEVDFDGVTYLIR